MITPSLFLKVLCQRARNYNLLYVEDDPMTVTLKYAKAPYLDYQAQRGALSIVGKYQLGIEIATQSQYALPVNFRQFFTINDVAQIGKAVPPLAGFNGLLFTLHLHHQESSIAKVILFVPDIMYPSQNQILYKTFDTVESCCEYIIPHRGTDATAILLQKTLEQQQVGRSRPFHNSITNIFLNELLQRINASKEEEFFKQLPGLIKKIVPFKPPIAEAFLAAVIKGLQSVSFMTLKKITRQELDQLLLGGKTAYLQLMLGLLS